ncbi:heme-thiolate peroxidase aromatic peroxygenase [Dacryopinax primogenitus]|uniref:Heme-thiolate peroxidase aromatic peroxygenase n=1 Tax=Dacryopinax primogenitus (strain DJM 731) TaxID=1858805 RepID=M5FSH4_DACPD|nr:heme-thiolate peroxidase aromatic peroxygenase [Dacryopinax primogenitus]EJT98828.1 heme-thiolate peroxidase aromatic peroxygenase [Dacryopinax primogenitus]
MQLRFTALNFILWVGYTAAWPAYERSLHAGTGGIASVGPILRRGAAPYSPQYPYTGALLDGQPGKGIGGIQVPAPGDTAHYYQHPPPGAQRGPCPGMNTLANHGFISRDGLTTFTELVAGMQNVWNVQWELAVILAVLGIATDGDPVTEMLSIGGAVTQQIGKQGEFTGNYGGLDQHNAFELDVSLTRDDFYLYGDAHTFNSTLFQMMAETAAELHNGTPIFDFDAVALHRARRYNQSIAENPWIVFPPGEIHNYGAGVFLFEAFPSSARNMTPDLETVGSFFGAVPLSNGSYGSQPERIPQGWHNRVSPLNSSIIANGGQAQYDAYPVPFVIGYGNGSFLNMSPETLVGGCDTYNTAISTAESSPNPVATYEFVRRHLDPIFASEGCPNNATLPL